MRMLDAISSRSGAPPRRRRCCVHGVQGRRAGRSARRPAEPRGLGSRRARPLPADHPRREGRRGPPHAHRRRRQGLRQPRGDARQRHRQREGPARLGRLRSRRAALGPRTRRQAAHAQRDQRVVRARDRRREHHRRRDPRGLEGHHRHHRSHRRAGLEQDVTRVRAPAGRAFLRPRRALRQRRSPRPLHVLVVRRGRPRRRRRQASRRGDAVPQRRLDDVLPGPVLPLERRLCRASRHHLPHRDALRQRAARRVARRGRRLDAQDRHLRARGSARLAR